MDLSIVILNWKVRDLLRKCLTSVFKYTSGLTFEIYVVDNASGDGSVEMVQQEFPTVKLIANDKNLGFSAGNNQALRQASGDWLLLLNPDTELSNNALTEMVNVIKTRPKVAVLGPKLLNSDQSIQASVRRFPSLSSQIIIMLKLHHVLAWLPVLKHYLMTDFDYNREQSVDQVMGAAFLLRREVLEKIGGLDERYFIWFEEVDYCRSVKDAGYDVLYTPQAEIIHHGGESFAQVFGPAKQKIYNASMRSYMLKHHGFLAWLVLVLLSPLSMALAWLVHWTTNKSHRS
ncbi:glycosyltransferase family 2 protein [Patescibacteria group bacterium]|nr:glycosyltransferase family 2 protein [Patescibacteria group bacterium]MBU1029286.1 glycosyltransferase family 2 protein [Patescibacteria group bacterium]MBU1915909.1 glycosyltransferase family 2 protein [Patescibacteria group bacterium]